MTVTYLMKLNIQLLLYLAEDSFPQFVLSERFKSISSRRMSFLTINCVMTVSITDCEDKKLRHTESLEKFQSYISRISPGTNFNYHIIIFLKIENLSRFR